MPKHILPTLHDVLKMTFRFEVIPDEQGGYVVTFPELRGCMTQVETLDEVPSAAREISALWLRSEYEANPERLAEVLKIPA